METQIAGSQKQATLLDKSTIIERWDSGVYNTLTYVYEALRYDRPSAIDIDNFIFNWQGVPDPDTGKVKRLTFRQVVTSLLTLQAKGAIVLSLSKIEVDVDP